MGDGFHGSRIFSPATASGLRFIPAQVPGTVASALREQKAWRMGDRARFDASEHWFRCRFDADTAEPGEEIILRIGGIATVAEVWLNGEKILRAVRCSPPTKWTSPLCCANHNELLIVCRSLAAALREQRRRQPVRTLANSRRRGATIALVPYDAAGQSTGLRARTRTRRAVASDRRWCAAVKIVVENWSRTAELDGSTGVVRVHLRLRSLQPGAAPVAGRLLVGRRGTRL